MFLCLWHVRKAWVENAIKKIIMLEDHVLVLSIFNEVMYSCGCPIDTDVILWAKQQIHLLATRYPNATRFMKYLQKHYLHKAAMWCVGNCNIPHAGQDTNASIESYHANIKWILFCSRKKLTGCKMDWLIYHLVGDMLTHYWYNIQCKMFGYVRNK